MEAESLIPKEELSRKTKGLILGRLGLIFVLLLASWWWTNAYLEVSIESFPNSLFLLFAVSLGLTAGYFLAFKFNDDFIWQIRIQLLTDVFLVTWIVILTIMVK